MEPAIAYRARGGGLVAPVALHQKIATDKNFTIVGHAQVDPGDHRAYGFDLDPAWPVGRDERRCLCLAIALKQIDPEGHEEIADFRVQRGAA